MPRDIKTRFTIEGEQQYRQSMRDAANAVKVLNSEQKLAAAQFKNTGNAEKYAADQARILQEKIKQQEQAVKAAEKALKELSDDGVSKNSKRWQEWQTRLNNAQTTLVNMETELNGLGSTMDNTSAKADGLTDSIGGISKKLSLQNITSGLKSIDDLLTSAARSALEIGKNLVSSVTEGASWADDLLTNSLIYGIDQETLQKWDRAATHFDTSVEAMVKSRQKLAQNMKYGSDDVLSGFAELGVNIYDKVLAGGKGETVERTLRKTEDVLWDVGEALAKLDRDDPNTEGLAMKLLGRNWSELLPLFTAGRKAYDEFMNEQSTVGEDTVQQMADANDALDALRYEWSVTLHQLEGSMAPALEGVSNILQGVLKEFNDYLATEEGQQKMQELSDAVTSLFEGLKDIKPGDVIDTAKDILTGIVDALKWISNNWTTVETGIKAIGIAWGTIKATEGVTTVLQLVNGLKGLGGASSAGAEFGSSWGTSFGAAVLKAVPWLAGLLVFTRGIWDETYHGSSEDADFYRGVLESQYEGDVTDEAVEAYGKLAELNVEIDKINEAMELYGLTVKEATKQQQEEVQDKNARVQDLRNAGIYEASWLLGGDKTSYNRLQEYWDLYRAGEASNKDWQDLISYFTEGKNRNGYDQTSLLRVLQRMYGLDRSMEDLPNEVFGLDAELNLTDDAQEILQKEADGLNPVSVPGVINLHSDDEEEDGGGSHGFANGLSFVPYDGYHAILHKGERVMTATANRNYTYNSNNYFGQVNLNNGMEIDALSESIARQNRRQNAGFGT